MEIWEPKPPGTLWATLGLLHDSFTFLIKYDPAMQSFQACCVSDATDLYDPVSHRKLQSLPTWHGLNATFHSNQSVSAMIVMFMVESEQTDSPAACLYDYYRILRMGHYRMLIPLNSFPVHNSLNTIT